LLGAENRRRCGAVADHHFGGGLLGVGVDVSVG